jgi:hypothetical protein
MNLISFQIKNYKVIDDTNTVKVDRKVTALVGKNESGKTAIMKAMWKSRNVADVEFDKLYDYPRDRYSGDRKETQKVTILKFELSSEEVGDIAAHCDGKSTKKTQTITYVNYYQGEDGVTSEIKLGDIAGDDRLGTETISTIKSVTKAIATKNSDDTTPVEEASTLAISQINEEMSVWESVNVKALEIFSTAVTKWISADAMRQSIAVEELQKLKTLIDKAKEGDPSEKAHEWAEKNLPVFIYFDDYGQLETKIHLPSYLSRKKDVDTKTRTQTALFEWSGIDPNEILKLGLPRADNETEEQVHRRHEKRRTLLESASFALTGDWVKWWTEKHHKLHFDVDGEYLVLKVSDEHNPFSIPFGERSHGFQWFFSFYLVFLVESKKAHKGAILLLDEPGLHLHPTLQSKLIVNGVRP